MNVRGMRYLVPSEFLIQGTETFGELVFRYLKFNILVDYPALNAINDSSLHLPCSSKKSALPGEPMLWDTHGKVFEEGWLIDVVVIFTDVDHWSCFFWLKFLQPSHCLSPFAKLFASIFRVKIDIWSNFCIAKLLGQISDDLHMITEQKFT